jgi:TRAP transporter 4TM/12TM fusion protein
MARRKLTGLPKLGIVSIAISWSLFQILTSSFWVLTPQVLRAIHLAFGTVLILVLYPPFTGEKGKTYWLVIDLVIIAFNIAAAVFITATQDTLSERAGDPLVWDIIFGIVVTLTVMEITRRTAGNILAGVAALMIAYSFCGPFLPGLLAHRGFDVARIATYMYDGMNGIYGMALGVSATFIYIFILYGNFLAKSGAGRFFIDLVLALIGKSRSGAANAIVGSNVLMATITGVPVASVTAIGSLGFPLMRKSGYGSLYTGSLGASAAIGATITPPVMGSAAFIMAEMTGISYGRIMVAAIIPAALFYLSLFISTGAYSAKKNIVGEVKDRQSAVRLLRTGWYYLLPIVSLVYLIASGRSPIVSAFWSIILMLVLGLGMTLAQGRGLPGLGRFGKDILDVLEKSAYEALVIMATCAAAGIITGTLSITGMATKFSSIMLQLSGGILFPALIFTAIASIILGMGMPIAACYIILAVIAAPALMKIGVSMLTAHYFVLYFGNFSAITPPVAIAAYAAAAMVNEDSWKLGWKAVRICLPTMLVAFAFTYAPSMLAQGVAGKIIFDAFTATIGVSALAFALEKWLWRPMTSWEMGLMAVAGVTAIFPFMLPSLIGIATILIVSCRLYVTAVRLKRIATEATIS